MATNTLPTRARALFNKSALPNRPHTSMHEMELAWQTQALAYRHAATTFHYCWPHPDAAPTVTLATANTDANFETDAANSVDLQLPWHHVNGQNAVNLMIAVATKSPQYTYRFRASLDTMVDSVTATDGDYSPPVNMSAVPRMPIWRRTTAGTNLRYALVPLEIRNPEWASDGANVIKIEARIDAEAIVQSTTVGATLLLMFAMVRERHHREL